MSLRSLAVLTFVGCIWGGSFLFIRVAVRELTPLQIVFLRSVLGATTLLVYVRLRHLPLDLDLPKAGVGALLALVGGLVPFLLIAWAETHIESGPTAVLNGSMPLFTLVIAAALLQDERMTAAKTLGVVVGFAGVFLLVFDSAGSLTGGSLLAEAAVLLSSGLYGLTAVCMRFALRYRSPTSVSTLQIGCLALMATALCLFDPPPLDLSLRVWASILALGILGTGVAYLAYYWLIEDIGSVRASFVAYIIPVVGVVAGALLLGERVAWNTFAGGAIVLLGIAIGNGLLRLPYARRAAARGRRV